VRSQTNLAVPTFKVQAQLSYQSYPPLFLNAQMNIIREFTYHIFHGFVIMLTCFLLDHDE